MKTNLSKLKFGVKKEQVAEIAFVLFLIVSVSITLIVAAYVYFEVGNQLTTTTTAMNSSPDVMTAYNKFSGAFGLFDTSMIFIVIGLTLGLLYTSFMIPTHPVFVVVNIIGFLVLVFISAIYSNTYYTIANSSVEFANITQTYYPKVTFIMHYLPKLAAGLVLIVSLVMYAKGRQDNNF